MKAVVTNIKAAVLAIAQSQTFPGKKTTQELLKKI